MIIMRANLRWLICGGLCVMGTAFAQLPQFLSDWQSLKIQETAEPVFPYRLQQLGVTTGEAHVVINTDAEGKLTEWLVVGYTYPEFAESAVVAIKQWKFEPARLHGERVGTTVEIIFNFEAKGTVVSILNISEHLEAQMLRLLGGMYAYRTYALRELDRIPTPLVTVKPLYSVELAAKGVKGKVTVDFYIDETGTVKMPAVSAKDDSHLTALAVAALRQWKFEPPTHGGKPVLVKASQVFNFGPE